MVVAAVFLDRVFGNADDLRLGLGIGLPRHHRDRIADAERFKLRFAHCAGDIVSAAAGDEDCRELFLPRLIGAADRFHNAVDLAVNHAVVDLKFERFVFKPRFFEIKLGLIDFLLRFAAHGDQFIVGVTRRRIDVGIAAVIDIAAVVRRCAVIESTVGLVHLKGHRAIALADEYHPPAAENVAVRRIAVADLKDDIRRAAACLRQKRVDKGAVIGAVIAPDIEKRAVLRTVAAAEIRHIHRRERRRIRLLVGERVGLRDVQAVVVHLDEIGVCLVERDLQLLHGNARALKLQVGERRVVREDRVADLDGVALADIVLCDLLCFRNIDRLHFIGLYQTLRFRLIVGIVSAEIHDRIDLHFAAAAADEKQNAVYAAADKRGDQHGGDRAAQPVRQVIEKRYLPLFHPLRLLS